MFMNICSYTFEGYVERVRSFFGCEMRGRLWLFDVPDIAGMALMNHCYTEMGTLADFLPDLYAKETVGK